MGSLSITSKGSTMSLQDLNVNCCHCLLYISYYFSSERLVWIKRFTLMNFFFSHFLFPCVFIDILRWNSFLVLLGVKWLIHVAKTGIKYGLCEPIWCGRQLNLPYEHLLWNETFFTFTTKYDFLKSIWCLHQNMHIFPAQIKAQLHQHGHEFQYPQIQALWELTSSLLKFPWMQQKKKRRLPQKSWPH